jgi:hypothetical protein
MVPDRRQRALKIGLIRFLASVSIHSRDRRIAVAGPGRSNRRRLPLLGGDQHALADGAALVFNDRNAMKELLGLPLL